MLEKESIYCCQLEGPLASLGCGDFGGVGHWSLEFFYPSKFLG